MRVFFTLCLFSCAVLVRSQYWEDAGKIFQTLFRQSKSTIDNDINNYRTNSEIQTTTEPAKSTATVTRENESISTIITTTFRDITTGEKISTGTVETSTFFETTTRDSATTVQSRDNSRPHEFYLSKREKPQIKISSNISQNLLPLPAGASTVLVKPTKYHYYPHNQHIYLLPECAIQQVCNAVYVRLNWTQPLCACPSRYRGPCSASLNSDDQHTTELMTDRKSKRVLTLAKTCEPTTDMRICRAPKDWSLLALQNIRTGKSHYLVICRCPDTSILDGPISHDQPTYASVPGIRVFGMMCVNENREERTRNAKLFKSPIFPWEKVLQFSKSIFWV